MTYSERAENLKKIDRQLGQAGAMLATTFIPLSAEDIRAARLLVIDSLRNLRDSFPKVLRH